LDDDLNIHERVFGAATLWAVTALVLSPLMISGVLADNYIEAFFTRCGSADTINYTRHFLRFGDETALFLPPYTIYFTISPLGESTYTADISFHELLPGLKTKERSTTIMMNRWQTEDSLSAKNDWYSYSYRITRDTSRLYDYFPKDSLTNNESIHFHARLLRDSYSDYKWLARRGYLENYFDNFRKELKLTRIGKLDLYIFPAGNHTTGIDIKSGVGFDIPRRACYLVYGEHFDSALPENIQRFIIYENWGYSARALATGLARYYLDDLYQAKKILRDINRQKLIKMLLNESPKNPQSDIICGAFSKYIIDKYSLGNFKVLYEKSTAGKLATQEALGKSLDNLINDFVSFEEKYQLNQPVAIYFSEAFRSQLWFDRAIEYDSFLSSGTSGLVFLKRLAADYFYVGDFVKSESCYSRLAQFKHDDLEARFLAEAAKFRSGKIVKGVLGLKKIAPRYPNAAKLLAEYYLDQEYFDSAAVQIERFHSSTDSWSLILRARMALAKGEDARADSIAKSAIPLCENIIDKIPGEGRGYIDVGYCQLYHGDFNAAESDFKTALFVENRPYYRGLSLLALGRLYDLKNNRAQAISYYNQAILERPGEYIISLAKKGIDGPYKIR
jgi:hypothetical protein